MSSYSRALEILNEFDIGEDGSYGYIKVLIVTNVSKYGERWEQKFREFVRKSLNVANITCDHDVALPQTYAATATGYITLVEPKYSLQLMAQMDAKALEGGRMVVKPYLFTNDEFNPYPLHQKVYQFDVTRSAVVRFNERHLSFRHVV